VPQPADERRLKHSQQAAWRERNPVKRSAHAALRLKLRHGLYTPRGFHDATRDVDVVRRWWAKWPAALVGRPTREATGRYVVDLGVDKASSEPVGEATWRDMGLADLLAGNEVPTRQARRLRA
jgi:hypothetical protein